MLTKRLVFERESVQENKTHKIPLDFEIKTDAPNPSERIRSNCYKNKRMCQRVDLIDLIVKYDETEKLEQCIYIYIYLSKN